MASITFDHATRQYPGAPRPAVDALNLDIADGEFLVLVGPSGCGKSTSCGCSPGWRRSTTAPSASASATSPTSPPKDRDIAMVFQNYALYPHMSVADNMGFALKIAGMNKAEIRKRVEDAAKILDLTDYLDRKPKALSGGQRQRVAMGRAIVRQPQCFLMDEPLSNLDAKLRVQTRTQIASLQRRLGMTTVYVTHDQVEAMTMGDRVALLKDGLLQQVDTPRNLYDKPRQHVRRRVHRLTRDEPRRRPADRRRRPHRRLHRPDPARRPHRAGRPGRPHRHARLPSRVRRGRRPDDGFPFEVMVVEELGSDAYAYGTLHLGRRRCARRQDVHRPRRRPPPPGQGRHHPPAHPRVRGARLPPRHRRPRRRRHASS